MKDRRIYFLLLLSAFLLSLPYYRWFSGIILFVAWVPLLFAEEHFVTHREHYPPWKVFFLGWTAFLAWNLLTVYWIWNATVAGAIAAYLINSFVMAVAFWLIHMVHRTLGDKMGHFGFLVIWTAYEHYYLNVQINFPWLMMGNGFAKDVALVQWYEFTGVLGGTFWVLFINLLLFLLLRHYLAARTVRGMYVELGVLVLLITVPVGWSLVRYHTWHEEGRPVEVVVVQPNIDPYHDKFSGMSNDEQLSIILRLADSLVTDSTDYVVAPETAINEGLLENALHRSRSIRRLEAFVRRHPRVKFVIGATTWRIYPPGPQPTPTARKRNDGSWEDIFNSALQIDTSGNIQVYHKSKLVVGVESIPHPELLRPLLGDILIDLGGSLGGYGTQKERTPLVSPDSTVRAAIAICYESVFGEYMTGFLDHGANLMFIITNDGWWGNTPGYRQHQSFARLRAIEERRSIARSANTGISCFIDQKGRVTQATPWWVPTAIRGTLHLNDRLTFYARHGDYFGRVSDLFTILLICYVLVARLTRKKKKSATS